MHNRSVKLRVTLWVSLVMTVIAAALFFGMTRLNREFLDGDIRARLTRTVDETANRLSFRGDPKNDALHPPVPLSEKDGRGMTETDGKKSPPAFENGNDNEPIPPETAKAPFRMYENGVHLSLYDENGERVSGLLPFSDEIDPSQATQGTARMTVDGDAYYVYGKTVNIRQADGSFSMQTLCGVISANADTFGFTSFTRTAVILLVLMILIASFGSYVVLGKAFEPVERIRRTAGAIAESRDLSKRIALSGNSDEIKRLADTFDEMLEKLQSAFEKEKQFTSDASHELRTPVAVIASECDYLLSGDTLSADDRESVESIKSHADRMAKLIGELLAISRMDRGATAVNAEEFDLAELLNFVCDGQEEIHADGDITLSREIPVFVNVCADRSLLVRLFVNLIANAYQYGKPGGHIAVSLKQDETTVTASVKDDGVGIAEENLDKIWERFYQEDAARTAKENGSMGLGLAMVKWIAEAHGGRVSVTSQKNIGSEFVFTMPKSLPTAR